MSFGVCIDHCVIRILRHFGALSVATAANRQTIIINNAIQITDNGQDDASEEAVLAAIKEDLTRQKWIMERAFDAGVTDPSQIIVGLTTLGNAINHLRTCKLSPVFYYDLYLKITAEILHKAEDKFDEFENMDQKGDGGGISVVELYENAQHCPNILSRLYILITVASTYIKSKRAPAKDVLFDLVELCRGVQHPIRGLFLRYYLCEMVKNKLPDEGSEYEGPGGNVKDAVEFLLQNFAEMNKLWVRMQHQGAVRDRQKRENERRKLEQLVGKNLHHISNLNGLTLNMYKDEVLPRILEQVCLSVFVCLLRRKGVRACVRASVIQSIVQLN